MYKTLLISSALLIGIYSHAQDSSKILDPVVITATKSPVKLSQTGKVVTIITRQQIERSQGKDFAQLLTEQSGMIVNGANSNPGKDKSIFLRGAANKYTLILLDGVPVSDPSGVGGAFDPRLFPVEQIDHIEILKGSQSTLYGSDAVAGVINIITKKGGENKVGLNGGATYGSYNSANANAGINGSTDLLDYNVNYSHTAINGISEAVDKDNIGNFDEDGFRRNSVQANLSFKAGKNIRISPYYRYSLYEGEFDADAFTDGNNTYDALMNNAGAIATIGLPNGTITANYGYTYTKKISATEFYTALFRGKFNTGEVYLTQNLNKNVKLLAGVNYQGFKIVDTSLAEKNPNTSIVSPYLSFFLQMPEGLNLEVGGRYNHHSKFGSNFTYSVNTSYLINNRLKAFANVSTGFRAPTVGDLFGPYGSNPNLKPEKSENFEAGLQLNASQKLQVTATGFYRNISDLIVFLDNKLTNIDNQRDKGAELEVSYNPNSKWNIRANYSYVTGKLTQTRDGKDSSFYNLIRRPKNSVTATVGYQATEKLFVSISLQSLGKRTDLFFEPVPPYGTVPVNLDSYALLGAYAEYKLAENIRFFIDGKNLTDKSFMEVYGYSAPGINVIGGFRFNL